MKGLHNIYIKFIVINNNKLMKCQNFALRHSVHNFTLTLSPLVNQMIYTSPLILPCTCSMNIVSQYASTRSVYQTRKHGFTQEFTIIS